ncbi:peptidoglycan bridge formation glycyltransferase FemA/FemB family protein [Chlorogloeopsis sp. ULAP02]|uniref:peptidoglycan bridge formation glycyltransferase FemA/FemB family protein n=1 Tax=Chlorogloeopsis sp. ULAP02 TaxID=3107926 RepID=UPI0031376D25
MNTQLISISNPLWMEILHQIRHDIYQLPEYISLESSRTQSIPEAIVITDGDKIFFAPYLLSQCDDITDEESITEVFDIKSPYGYPGILLNDAAANTPGFPDLVMNEFKSLLRDRGVCSAFFRLHPILNDNFYNLFLPNTFTLNGNTISIDLRISESQIWTNTRKGHRSTINKCKRLGMVARMVSIEEYLDEFTVIYQETMDRVGAADRYYTFDLAYFTDMYNALREKLHLCIVEYEGEIACAGLYTENCGIVQSTLGGTKNKFVHLSPSSLETDFARYWAKERGNEFLHLGGGVGCSKDNVYTFKAGFSQLEHNFLTLRLIIDEEKYRYLVALRAKHMNIQPEELMKSNFFPAYRSPK